MRWASSRGTGVSIEISEAVAPAIREQKIYDLNRVLEPTAVCLLLAYIFGREFLAM